MGDWSASLVPPVDMRSEFQDTLNNVPIPCPLNYKARSIKKAAWSLM